MKPLFQFVSRGAALLLMVCISALGGCLPAMFGPQSQEEGSLLRQRLAPEEPVLVTVRSRD